MILIFIGFPAIVTRFYLKVRPRPDVMLKSIFIYPISQYKVVMDWITKVCTYTTLKHLTF